MPSMTTVKCNSPKCKKEFEARTADVKRGWGKFCSKSCKAYKQTCATGITGPDYRAAGKTVHAMRSGSYAKSKFKNKRFHPYVSNETYLKYANEYGGTPLFSRSGEYVGMIPEPFDNSTDCQNSDYK